MNSISHRNELTLNDLELRYIKTIIIIIIIMSQRGIIAWGVKPPMDFMPRLWMTWL